jgi:hypothetical protein
METDEMLVQKNCLICETKPLYPFFDFHKTGVPPFLEEHRFVYYYRAIRYCKACMRGVIEYYEHDCCLIDDPADFLAWFVLDKVDLLILETYVRQCSTNYDPHCECDVHRHLQDSFENIIMSPHFNRSLVDTHRIYSWLTVDRVNARPNFRLMEGAYYVYVGNLVSKSVAPE